MDFSNGFNNQNPNDGDDDWVPEEALNDLNKSIAMEKQLHPEETNEQLTRRLFRENSPLAAQAIINIAIHGSNERTRLDASKYITERVLGRIGDDAYEGESSPVDSFINDVADYVKSKSKNGK